MFQGSLVFDLLADRTKHGLQHVSVTAQLSCFSFKRNQLVTSQIITMKTLINCGAIYKKVVTSTFLAFAEQFFKMH